MCNGLVKYSVQMVAITTYRCVFSLCLTPSFPLSLSSLFFLLCLHLLLASLPPAPSPLLPSPQPLANIQPQLRLPPLRNDEGSTLPLMLAPPSL